MKADTPIFDTSATNKTLFKIAFGIYEKKIQQQMINKFYKKKLSL